MRLSRSYWLDAVALAVAVVVFVRPVRLHPPHRGQGSGRAAQLDLAWPTSWHIKENLTEVLPARNNMLVTSDEEQPDPDSRVSDGHSWSCARWSVSCSTAGGTGVARVVNRVRLVGPDHPSGRRADDLRAPGSAPVQVAVGAGSGRGRVPAPFASSCSGPSRATIPREIDEAAIMDGCTGFDLFRA